MVTIFGIRNCDTVRKARRWLDGHTVEYSFHDVRSDGLSRAQLESWVEKYTKKKLNHQNISEEDLERLKALGYTN